MFFEWGVKNVHPVPQWSHDRALFDAWREGKTGTSPCPSRKTSEKIHPLFFTFPGVPVVDANMRELKSTGFMSNRGRQLVASFLVQVFSFFNVIFFFFVTIPKGPQN